MAPSAGHDHDGVEDHHEDDAADVSTSAHVFRSGMGFAARHIEFSCARVAAPAALECETGAREERATLGVLCVDHVAGHGLELGERGDVLQIPSNVGIFPECFDICRTAPLRIDEHAPAILALEGMLVEIHPGILVNMESVASRNAWTSLAWFSGSTVAMLI